MPKFELIVKKDRFSNNNHVKFIVVDLELGDKYPINYVCILPFDFHTKTNFSKLFANEEEAKKVWSSLLNDLKTKTKEPEILKEIDKRFKSLLIEPDSEGIKNVN